MWTPSTIAFMVLFIIALIILFSYVLFGKDGWVNLNKETGYPKTSEAYRYIPNPDEKQELRNINPILEALEAAYDSIVGAKYHCQMLKEEPYKELMEKDLNDTIQMIKEIWESYKAKVSQDIISESPTNIRNDNTLETREILPMNLYKK